MDRFIMLSQRVHREPSRRQKHRGGFSVSLKHTRRSGKGVENNGEESREESSSSQAQRTDRLKEKGGRIEKEKGNVEEKRQSRIERQRKLWISLARIERERLMQKNRAYEQAEKRATKTRGKKRKLLPRGTFLGNASGWSRTRSIVLRSDSVDIALKLQRDSIFERPSSRRIDVCPVNRFSSLFFNLSLFVQTVQE